MVLTRSLVAMTLILMCSPPAVRATGNSTALSDTGNSTALSDAFVCQGKYSLTPQTCDDLVVYSQCIGHALLEASDEEENEIIATVRFEAAQERLQDCILHQDDNTDHPLMRSVRNSLEMVVAEGEDIVLLRHRRMEKVSLFNVSDRLVAVEDWAEGIPGEIEEIKAVLDAKVKSAVVDVTALIEAGDDQSTKDIQALSQTTTDKLASASTSIANVRSDLSKASSALDTAHKLLIGALDTKVAGISTKAAKTETDLQALTNQLGGIIDDKLKVVQKKIDDALVNQAPTTEKNSGSCTTANLGRPRYNTATDSLEICKANKAWVGTSPKGTIVNPVTDCFAIKDKPDGFYYVSAFGGSRKLFCRKGWALAAVVFTANCLDHYNRGLKRGENIATLHPDDTKSTTKWSDTDINTYRTKSAYTGDRDIKMHADALCGARDLLCHKDCKFNAQSSIGRSRCSLCAVSESAGFQQGSPNSGTRALGHHHWQRSFFAWVRHPEQGCGNRGFRSDACGSSNGELWVR